LTQGADFRLQVASNNSFLYPQRCCNLIGEIGVKEAVITTQEEYTLIDRIIAGEETLYATLVDKYKSYAFTIALKVVENRAEAEEIAQDGFIKAFRYLNKFNREAKFSTWLYRIVFNTAISYKRKSKQQFQSIENSIIEYSERADNEIEKEDKRIFLEQAMKKLSEADRVAVQLYYIKGYSLEETAEMLNQNINTLKVRVHRARQRLADELKRILQAEALTL
jgi:RNA polymerase sigma factor (sigma-70 family)